MVDGHCLVALPYTINEILTWLTSLAYLIAGMILEVTVQRLDISSLPPPLLSCCRYHFCEPDVKVEQQQAGCVGPRFSLSAQTGIGLLVARKLR